MRNRSWDDNVPTLRQPRLGWMFAAMEQPVQGAGLRHLAPWHTRYGMEVKGGFYRVERGVWHLITPTGEERKGSLLQMAKEGVLTTRPRTRSRRKPPTGRNLRTNRTARTMGKGKPGRHRILARWTTSPGHAGGTLMLRPTSPGS